ncbi:MAG: hypothetical protein IPN22_11400 [Bacteroidetes bacterium]|nr:hypothetical protein [Bacteroidota bacterium]
MPAIRIDHYPFLLHLGGVLVMLFELYFPFLVLSGWGRVVAFVCGLSMHKFIGYFMYIEFKDLQYTYAVFMAWDRLFKPSTWFNSPNENESYKTSLSQLFSNRSYKLVFLTGTGLLSINFYFGLNRIHSWPFSSYPTYSSIVLAERDYIYFEAYDKQKKLLRCMI